MIELDNVHKRLGDRDILKGLTLRVPKGVNFVLMGPSGTGKSVTLKHVIGIFRPDRGDVRVDGQDVGGAQTIAFDTAGRLSTPAGGEIALGFVHRDDATPGTRLVCEGQEVVVAALPFVTLPATESETPPA